MNRREALIAISVISLRGAAWALPNFRFPATGLGHLADESIEDRLRADLALLGPRIYSEEGIPVFLACENLVGEGDAHKPGSPSLPALNKAVAAALRDNADAFLRMHPDARERDVAPLIEVLAYRNVAKGDTLEQR